MLTIEGLKEYGANTEEGLKRCMGNEGFYLTLVKTVPTEKNFARLKEALATGKLDEAFEAAHALKGVLANLSLTPLSEVVGEMTEHLRAREQMDYAPLLERLEEMRSELERLIS